MIPWDFGIIRAIKELLGISIFPSVPSPEHIIKESPYIIFQLNNILQGKNLLYRVGFTLTLIDNNGGKNLEILKNITKIIRKELTLKQNSFVIGSARIKIESVESKGNNLVINFTALLQLKAIYEDGEENE